MKQNGTFFHPIKIWLSCLSYFIGDSYIGFRVVFGRHFWKSVPTNIRFYKRWNLSCATRYCHVIQLSIWRLWIVCSDWIILEQLSGCQPSWSATTTWYTKYGCHDSAIQVEFQSNIKTNCCYLGSQPLPKSNKTTTYWLQYWLTMWWFVKDATKGHLYLNWSFLIFGWFGSGFNPFVRVQSVLYGFNPSCTGSISPRISSKEKFFILRYS